RYVATDGDRFADDDDSIFGREIDALAAAGVTRGCNPPANDRLCPRDDVTRGQMAGSLAPAQGPAPGGVPPRPDLPLRLLGRSPGARWPASWPEPKGSPQKRCRPARTSISGSSASSPSPPTPSPRSETIASSWSRKVGGSGCTPTGGGWLGRSSTSPTAWSTA